MSKRELTVLTAALALVALAALRPSIRGNDGVGYYVYLASLLRGGDLDFSDDYRAFDALKHYEYVRFADLPTDPRTGRPSNRYGVGAALLWSPFVAATHAGVKWLRPELATTLSRPYEWAVGVATAFWGSLGLGLIYAWLRRRWGRLPAAATLAGLMLATPLGFYLYAHGSMSHGVSFFAAAAALLAFERAWQRPGVRTLALCGFACGWLVMIRFQDAPWVLVIGGALIYRGFRLYARAATLALSLLAFGAAFLLAMLPQLAVWRYLYGSWLSGPAPYLNDSAGSFSAWPRHWAGVLLSERGGVLAWHPLIAIGLAGLVMILHRAPGRREPEPLRVLAAVGLIGFAAQLWLIASWSVWWAGASFGNRFFISALPFLAPGMAWWGRPAAARGWRIVGGIMLSALILWNMGLLIQYATELTPREAWIPWTRVIRQNLIDVPAMILRRLF